VFHGGDALPVAGFLGDTALGLGDSSVLLNFYMDTVRTSTGTLLMS
jgi:hypothetical protein